MVERTPDTLPTRWSRIEQMQGREADAAWRWFLDRYRSFVVALLTRMTRSRALGERAADDFWGYFFQHRIHERADRGRRFRAFLAGVVRRFGLDWSARNRGNHNGSTSPTEQVIVESVAEDEELRLYAQALVHRALRRLETGEGIDGSRERVPQPDAGRTLRLFYGIADGPDDAAAVPMKASEVAKALGVELNPNAMHKRLYDARRRLREILVEEVGETVPTRSDLDQELAIVFASIHRVALGLVE